MNLLPESNGLYKIKHANKINKVSKIKILIVTIIAIVLLGFISQQISNFIGNETIEPTLNYTRVDGKKLEYNFEGKGEYTVVFIGAIGANLYEWNEVASEVREKEGLKTFVYNRNGYGFSDTSNIKTILKEADDLKILLRKSGVYGDLILVGEEYGSLIATQFAKEYPDSVKGIVLVDPYDENTIKSDDFKKQLKKSYDKALIERYGSYFYVTSLLSKFNKTFEPRGFEESLDDNEIKEFNVHKTKTNYRKAISNEYSNLNNYNESIMEDGMFKNTPFYIVSRTEDNSIRRLGNPDFTDLTVTNSDGLLSIESASDINNGIASVLKEAKKIAKREKDN